MVNNMWKYWCKAIGTKSFDEDRKADKVALIRTTWIIMHVLTCLFIIMSAGRNLNFW